MLLTPAQLAFSDSVLIWASYVRITAKSSGSIQSNDLWRAGAAEWDESLFGLWGSEPLLNIAVRYDFGGVGEFFAFFDAILCNRSAMIIVKTYTV